MDNSTPTDEPRLRVSSGVITHVIVDTSEFSQDLVLRSAAWRRLLLAAAEGWLSVRVPRVVLMEAARQHRERLQKVEADAATLARTAESLGAEFAPKLETGIIQDREYTGWLLDRLTAHGVEVLPWPGVPHDALVRRDLDRKRPFNNAGEGYRDALIWLSVLAVAKAEAPNRIAFVTRNVKDFGEETDKRRLHPDLQSELEQSGLRRDSIVRFTDVRDLVDALHVEERIRVEPDSRLLVDVNDQASLPTLEHMREKLAEVVSTLRGRRVAAGSFPDFDEAVVEADVPTAMADVRVRAVDSDFIPRLFEFADLLDGSKELNIYTRGRVTLSGSMPAATAETLGSEITLLGDLPEDEKWVAVDRDVWLFFWVEWDPRLDVVTSVQFELAQGVQKADGLDD